MLYPSRMFPPGGPPPPFGPGQSPERVITQLVEEPSNRDRWPETQFDPAVV